MSSNQERRALAAYAVTRLTELNNAIAAATYPGHDFWSSSSSNWGPGAWQTYAELLGLRKAAEIMGFELAIDSIERYRDHGEIRLTAPAHKR